MIKLYHFFLFKNSVEGKVKYGKEYCMSHNCIIINSNHSIY